MFSLLCEKMVAHAQAILGFGYNSSCVDHIYSITLIARIENEGKHLNAIFLRNCHYPVVNTCLGL